MRIRRDRCAPPRPLTAHIPPQASLVSAGLNACTEQQFTTLEKRVLAREVTIKQRGDTIAKLELDLKSLGAPVLSECHIIRYIIIFI